MKVNKIYLDVPFKEKDEAKKFGVKWGNNKKLWFTDGRGTKKGIEKWIPTINLITPLVVIKNYRICWKCKNITPIIAFTAKDFIETSFLKDDICDFVNDDESPDKEIKTFLNELNSREQLSASYEYKILFSNLNFYLISNLKKIITEKYPFYRLGRSKAAGIYVANHCVKCDSIQGDFPIFCEPDGEFWIESREELDKLEKEIILEENSTLPLNVDIYYSSL